MKADEIADFADYRAKPAKIGNYIIILPVFRHNVAQDEEIVESGGNLVALLLIAGIVYLSLGIMAFMMVPILGYFDSTYPAEFKNLEKCKACLGNVCKLIPMLLIFLHWTIIFLIIIEFFMIIGGKCYHSVNPKQPGQAYTEMQAEAYLHVAILSISWVTIMLIGTIVRSIIYYASYAYDPDLPGQNMFRLYCCKKCGP